MNHTEYTSFQGVFTTITRSGDKTPRVSQVSICGYTITCKTDSYCVIEDMNNLSSIPIPVYVNLSKHWSEILQVVLISCENGAKLSALDMSRHIEEHFSCGNIS